MPRACPWVSTNERPIPSFKEGLVAIPGKERSKVDVDDAVAFLAHFKKRKKDNRLFRNDPI